MVNSCQGKVAGALFRLNCSIHQHALPLDVKQVLDGWDYFQSCNGKHSSLHIYCHSLSRTVSRKLNSLKYLESITDALHRVKSWANDIELTEINKWC